MSTIFDRIRDQVLGLQSPGYGVLAPSGSDYTTAPTVAGIMGGTLPQSTQISGPVAVTAVQSGANVGPTPPPPPPPAPVRPGIKPGGDPAVWDLQNQLNQQGAGLVTDGLMGPLTRAAQAKYSGGAVPSGTSGSGGGTPAPAPSMPAGGTSGGTGGGSDDFLAQLMQQLGPAPAMPSWDPAQVAKDQIQLQYGSQEDALKNALNQLGVSYDASKREQTEFGNDYSTRLTNLFNALGTTLGQNKDKDAATYDQARQETGASYDEAGQRLNSLNSGIVNSLLSNADRLGIAQGAGTPLARIMEMYGQMAGSNISHKATSLAGMDQDKANSLALDQSQITSSQRQGATAQSDLAQQVQTALSQLGLQNAQQTGNIYQQQASLEGNKAADLRNTQAQLANSLYGMQRQSRMDQLAELIQLGTLDTQRQNLAIRGQTAQNDSALGWAKLAQSGQATDLAHQLDALKGQLLGSQTDLANARTDYYNNGGANATKGLHGDLLEQYLDTPQDGLWGAGGSGPIFRTAINDLIDKANQQKGLTGSDPLQWALAAAPTFGQQSGHPDISLSGLQAALLRYYKGQ